MTDNPLTSKEQRIVDEVRSIRPSLGEQVEKDIRNPSIGLSEIIRASEGEELEVKISSSTNSFMYPRIGG